MNAKNKLDLLAIASIPLVMTLGNSMLIPVLPVIEKELKISPLQVSIIITVYSVVAILLIPVAGYLSDRFGRKKVILPGLLIAGVGGLVSGWAAIALSKPYWFILVGRLLQGVGSSGAFPVVLPLVGDLFQSEKEVSSSLGIIETANTFGKVLSPIVGAFLAAFAWYLPFWFIPVFCLVSLILVACFVKSPEKKEEVMSFQRFLKNLKGTFKSNGRWLFAIFIVGGIIMFVLFGVLFYLSTILEDQYFIKGIKKGFVLAVPLLALSICSYIAGKKIGESKKVMKWTTFFGILLLVVSTLSIPFIGGLYFLLGALFVSGIGIGVALPCLDALITEGIDKEERGTITSLYSSMRFVGVALGPPIYAIIMKSDDAFIFYTTACFGVIGALFVLFAIKPEKSDQGEGNSRKERLQPIIR
ncbi:MFS transporter [Fictibacillus gelatini]|uniref:MFS transporter n=1 Tax=Fictibacillus gelatini TaxID=225985 RepID=UPI0004291854|nr:MFS transporter [Fictibacillus gelatini]